MNLVPSLHLLSPSWKSALKSCADPSRARQFLAPLATAGQASVLKGATAEQARILCALLSGSQAMSELLAAHPDWLAGLLDIDKHPRREQGLRREVNGWLQPLVKSRDYTPAFARLRQFKQREMLRIATRDLARLGQVSEITRELSDVADVCLGSVLQLGYLQLSSRLGEPHHLDADGRWQPTRFCVLGLGKLGGQELNYSSDIDVLFVYSEEGNVFKQPPKSKTATPHGMTNHQFFRRLAESFIAEISQLTPDGRLFRIDLRLRPEGNAGPLVRSLASYESYYAQAGQTWERMMLIKARGVAGDASLAGEFVEMIQPFRYRRSLNEGALREIAAMKERIEREVVKAGELDRNVKLGRGGIREIEFVVQTLQILHAGRNPFLHEPQTLTALPKLVQYKLLEPGEAEALSAAYAFLRNVEHRLQMENNLQTHTIWADAKSLQRLAALMGLKSVKEFARARAAHTRNVRRVYDKLLKSEPAPSRSLPGQFQEAETEWKNILADHSFKDIPKSFHLVKTFAQGPGFVHVSERTNELATQLLVRFLEKCPRPNLVSGCVGEGVSGSAPRQRASHLHTHPLTQLHFSPPSPSQEARREIAIVSDPDRVVARLDSFITAYGSRAMLYETWAGNPSLFDLLLLLFDRSEFLAEVAIATPDLVDDLVLSGRLRRRKSAAEILRELQHGRQDDDQRLWIRRYHQVELMRIGLRDILGLADFEQNLFELTALADGCLQYALQVALRKNQRPSSPLAIVGLGKSGGAELNYGSDLDIIFVAETNTKNLSKLQGLAVGVMDLLSSRTEQGIAFVTDARLRPDGEKGLLVNTLPAFEEYYRQRAHLWEIQALTRIRPVAGNPALGAKFQELAGTLANFKQPALPLSAWSPDWKQQIARMRSRIEKERTPAGKDALAIKTGVGGLIDAEFIAQTLCLENGWQEPNTLQALHRAQASGILPPEDAHRLIENYRQLRRVESILRRWSFAGETLLPDDEPARYRVAVRCGWSNAADFMQAIHQYRQAIRAVYAKVFSGR